MAQSGFKKILTIRKYVDNVATDFTKTNVQGTEDYFAPQFDLGDCSSEDPRATTTTTSAPSTTSTTTSAQQAVGNIAAIACCTPRVIDPASENLTSGAQKVCYVKVKEVGAKMYTLVNSGNSETAIRRNKLVIDNTIRNLYQLKTTISGYIYGNDEGIIRDESVLSTRHTIDPTNQAEAGHYLISAVSILDPNEYDDARSRWTPKFAPYLTLTWDSVAGRLKFKINYVETYEVGVEVNDTLGGDLTKNNNMFTGNNNAAEME